MDDSWLMGMLPVQHTLGNSVAVVWSRLRGRPEIHTPRANEPFPCSLGERMQGEKNTKEASNGMHRGRILFDDISTLGQRFLHTIENNTLFQTVLTIIQ